MAKSKVMEAVPIEEVDDIVSTHQILEDMQNYKIAVHSGLSKSIGETLGQRSGILKDIMQVSVAVMGGAITLLTVSPAKIKTPVLFYLSCVGLLLCIIASLAVRMVIAKVWNTTIWTIQKHEDQIRAAVGRAKYHGDNDHAEAMVRLNDIMSKRLVLPKAPWPAKFKAISWLLTLFIVSLVAISVSLLFKISVS